MGLAGTIQEKEKRRARRRNCVGSTPTKRFFALAVIVAVVFLRFLLELGGNWPDFAKYARTLAKIIEYDEKTIENNAILQE